MASTLTIPNLSLLRLIQIINWLIETRTMKSALPHFPTIATCVHLFSCCLRLPRLRACLDHSVARAGFHRHCHGRQWTPIFVSNTGKILVKSPSVNPASQMRQKNLCTLASDLQSVFYLRST